MTTIPPTYRQEPNGSCYLIDPPSFDYSAPYWGKDGRSTLEDQRFNVHGFQNQNGMTKSENIILHCVGTSILEIGCAPGAFLKLAVEQGFECEGIAPEKGLSQAINAYCGCPVIEGFFPDAIKDSDRFYDNVVAMDVFEHIVDGAGFVEQCMKRLNPNGRLILMIPMLSDDEDFRERDFCDEHVVIYHKGHLEEWLKPVVFDKWIDGHWIVVVEKKVNFAPVLCEMDLIGSGGNAPSEKLSTSILGIGNAEVFHTQVDKFIEPLKSEIFEESTCAAVSLPPIMESPLERVDESKKLTPVDPWDDDETSDGKAYSKEISNPILDGLDLDEQITKAMNEY